MAWKIRILLFVAFLSLSMAQQLSFGDNSNRLCFYVTPLAQNFSVLVLKSDSRNDQLEAMRDDYTYTSGIGVHKVHTRPTTGWNSARQICNEEGGHLAIINSVAEARTVGNLLIQANFNYAHIGTHNYFDKGRYVTLFSESLEKAGYNDWADGQPSGADVESCRERCGGIDSGGKLHDVCCGEHWVFVCELPLH